MIKWCNIYLNSRFVIYVTRTHQACVKRPGGRLVNAPELGSRKPRVRIPLEAELSSWLYVVSLHRAFHHHHSIVSIWLYDNVERDVKRQIIVMRVGNACLRHTYANSKHTSHLCSRVHSMLSSICTRNRNRKYTGSRSDGCQLLECSYRIFNSAFFLWC